MQTMRLALPVRSPYPLIVPWSCVAPASTAATELATAQPVSFWAWMPIGRSPKWATTSPTMRPMSWGSVPPFVSHSTSVSTSLVAAASSTRRAYSGLRL